MDSSVENAPFILRFSKYMYRKNPRTVRGGSPRPAEGKSINIVRTIENIQRGCALYKSFDYNKGYPTFNIFTLKEGSLSKSLRYHFINGADINLIGSISPSTLIFSLDDEYELGKFENILTYSRNKNFRKSLQHIDNIECLLPSGKKAFSDSKDVILKLFPHKNSDNFLNFLKYDLNISCSNIKTIDKLNYVTARINDTYLHDRILTHSLVSAIEPSTEAYLYQQYIRHEDLPLNCIQKRDINKTYPKAGLVDSGISENSFLREWKITTESYLTSDEKNPTHGTFVCGRMLKNDEQFGGILFLNIEIIPDNGRLSIDTFYENMRTVLLKYSKTIKIYNISLGTNREVSTEFSTAAYMFDTLQAEFDVLFILSAGNATPSKSNQPRPLTQPAESVHAITVGSVSHTDTNIQKLNSPSLFTRHGPAPLRFVKPDLASFGGAHEERFGRLKPVGVYSIGIRNELAEDCGTSHAAPIVTAKAAKLYHQYSHAFKSTNITKTLLIHNTFLNNPSKTLDPFTGFGIIDDAPTSENHVTYIHEGIVKPESIVELPNIPIPPEMIEDSKIYGEIILTLVYKTATDISFPHYYCMTMLDISLGYYKNDKWVSLLTAKDAVGCPKEKDARELFKWQPTKVFRRELKGKYISETLSLRIIPSKRDFYSQKDEISYSFAISFTHQKKNLFQCIIKNEAEFSHILESASDMWKTCG